MKDKWLQAFASCFVAAALCLSLLFSGGCALRLHPLLNELNGGKPLTDEQVDIRIERTNYFAVQATCIGQDPAAVIGIGTIFACAKMRCAENKFWQTDRICTCQITLIEGVEWPLEHEKKHCYGYEDVLW